MFEDSGTDANDELLARLEELEEANPDLFDGPDSCSDKNPHSEENDPCASAWGEIMCKEHLSCNTCPLNKK